MDKDLLERGRHFEFRMKLQHDGGLQSLEIIVGTYEISQVNDCGFLTFIFVLFLVMKGK